MLKKLLLLFFIGCTFSSFAQRAKYNFNSDWKVFVGDDAKAATPTFNDAAWKAVTLPYAWNEDEAFKKDIADLSTGIAWYRKHFKLPPSARGQKVFLEFEGIRQAGEFYLNGKPIGIHENGAMAFGFDVTSAVNFDGENVLAARIDNDWNYREKATNTKFQWEDKNFNANYGGISKNVYLHIVPPVYQTLPLFSNLGTTGVYMYADNFNVKNGSATVHAVSQVRNEAGTAQTIQYFVTITDDNGKAIAGFAGKEKTLSPGAVDTVSAMANVNRLQFWSWGYGYLYNVATILKINGKETDKVVTRTGFRKTEFKNGMIYLNDRVIQVHGYAQRTTNEWPAVGASVPAWMSDYSNRLMVEGNGNLVRWMHITPWKQDIESCDRVGLIEAMQAGDAEKDASGIQWKQRVALMRDAIIYNRNNPSIIFYECGNESISEEHMGEMKAVKETYDPHGGRAIGSREMLDSKVAEYGGEMLYVNKSAHIPMWAMEYSRDEGLRKYWDDYTPPYHKDGDGPLYKGANAAEYNRNQESHATENVKRWYDYWKERPGTGSRVSSGGVNIVFSESNTHHRGAENYRRSGEVDALRIIKENYYANQVMWNGWVDVEKSGIHIIGHWNYEPGVVKTVYVVSTADKVELKVNGKSLGFGEQSSRFLYSFKNVAWQAGNISAVGYNNAGKEICTAQITTAGPPAAVRLKEVSRPTPWLADGHDMILLEAEVVDAKGARCPTALNTVYFSMTGPAEWRGGIAQGTDNYILSKSLPVECGVNRVLIRSATRPGTVTITATADGLKGTSFTTSSKANNSTDGWSSTLPSAGLPSFLGRGATPATPSYTISRKAVAVVKATAGANSDSSFAAYDDNELSDWHNDGRLSTAWVELTLEKEATVSEVALKLNNFRSRSYPLRITLDGKEIFNDATTRGLGYFTAICRPQRGKVLRIQLVQASKESGEKIMAEVSGKKLDDGVVRNDADAKGMLSIIEAEVYEKAGLQ